MLPGDMKKTGTNGKTLPYSRTGDPTSLRCCLVLIHEFNVITIEISSGFFLRNGN